MFWRKKKKYKIGIALGGGGARGFAHLGVIKALKEKGIEPDIIAGVSAGAIAGAFLAAGIAPTDALRYMQKYNFTGLSKLNIPKTGILSLEKMKLILEQKIPIQNIEDLPTPFIVGVTDVLAGRPVYVSSGSLPEIVQASAAIPVLFSPVKINHRLYSDGGIFDNVPTKPLQELCQKVIAVNINPIQEITELKNLIQVTARAFQLAVNKDANELEKNCDVLIEPDLNSYDIMDTSHAQQIFDIGYEQAKKMDIRL